MLLAARRQFKNEPDVKGENLEVLTELTLTNLETENGIDEQDFLNRVDIICSLGQNVMISNYQEYYKLVGYLSEINRGRKIGIILGISNLQRVFDDKYYTDLRGGVLEAFGTLFGRNVKLYVYPSLVNSQPYDLDNFKPPEKQESLFQFLIDNDKLVPVKNVKPQHLGIDSDEVLRQIQCGEEGWEELVPRKVVSAIKSKHLFNYASK
jgi:hypothetical protein